MTYAPADAAFAARLEGKISPKAFKEPEPRYFEEPRGRWTSPVGLVLAPENVEEVRQILMAANEARVRVVPYGGGTGLVGAQIPGPGPAPLILSMERMNRVRAVYPEENVMIVEAGVIMQDVHEEARKHDRMYPLSLAAKGSARIGGNLGTNAGGVNVVRYGNARDLCLGIEAVLPDGRVINGLSRLRKDNTGYDLRNLLIGSEGTLAVITAATLKLVPIPPEEGTAYMVVESPDAAVKLLSMAKSQLGEGVSAFELIKGMSFDFMRASFPEMQLPFYPAPPWMVLIDVGLARGNDPQEALENLFAEAAEAGLVSDGVIAQSEAQRQAFWDIREYMPLASRAVGGICSHDVSLPLSEIPEFLRRADQLVSGLGPFRINCFGHMGDGNLHYNLFPPEGETRDAYMPRSKEIYAVVHELVVKMGGSFSAEHGVGRLKTDEMKKFADPTRLDLMRGIKALFDPNGIMNPGAVLPEA
ncbi:2-hydroxyacid dehydrogenase [Oceanicola sp. 22II-s10i]|uniref:FAD-binding oxidoreductase n=1 Tax=Oceanicola sp. 22II-s10i TaxID=1317116 RepID=UPI000B529304|nr:FAD-binding oxidoreductase [Oceanicola sp. 22II-s10i]OWU86443.1 2-hydroxyacid dehydrogenase [Oceanicola sp. 22II-s10i]